MFLKTSLLCTYNASNFKGRIDGRICVCSSFCAYVYCTHFHTQDRDIVLEGSLELDITIQV